MRSQSRIKTAVALALLCFGICFFPLAADADPIAVNPNAKQKLSPEIAERWKLCSGNLLKDSVRYPSCSGWQLANITEAPNTPNETPFYLGHYSDACTPGTDGKLRCFFKSGKAACKAWTEARNVDPNLSNDLKKVCGCGEPASNSPSETYKCAWCYNGEKNCNNGAQFFEQLKCGGGQNDIDFGQLPEQAYQPYCFFEVNGPYSAFADEYKVCGTQYYAAFPGMEFTLNQKTQIRNINRTQNGITQKNKLKSDLAGFCYPKPTNQRCIKNHPSKPGYCVEPGQDPTDTLLTSSPPYNLPESGQIHHVIPKSDARNLKCPCGKNSMKNAVIISAQLNRYFSNRDRTTFQADCDSGVNELDKVNGLTKYIP